MINKFGSYMCVVTDSIVLLKDPFPCPLIVISKQKEMLQELGGHWIFLSGAWL